MRPPTELERIAVFLAAMAVTRALLPRMQPRSDYARRMGHGRPIEERREEARRLSSLAPVVDRRIRVYVNGVDITDDPRQAVTDPYRARYGAENPREN